MNSQEILQNVQGIFRDVFDVDNLVVARETTAKDVENWDSLAHINLIVAIEKQFKIKFALGELQSLKNVGEMINLIAAKSAA
jgi:acyl carrier protein